MALLKGKLFAGALFAGALLTGQQVASIPEVQPPVQRASYGGGTYASPLKQYKDKASIEQQELLRKMQAEDDIMLNIIINAVTSELLS